MTICQKILKNLKIVLKLLVIHHQSEEDWKFSDGANCQYAIKLHTEERSKEILLKPTGSETV
jgi:hypothetical protein